jgi:hypothetical protein
MNDLLEAKRPEELPCNSCFVIGCAFICYYLFTESTYLSPSSYFSPSRDDILATSSAAIKRSLLQSHFSLA